MTHQPWWPGCGCQIIIAFDPKQDPEIREHRGALGGAYCEAHRGYEDPNDRYNAVLAECRMIGAVRAATGESLVAYEWQSTPGQLARTLHIRLAAPAIDLVLPDGVVVDA